MTTKQKLVLLLIYSKPGINGIYSLVKIFERHDFPAEMEANLKPMLEKGLIHVSQNFDNGTPSHYAITNEGEAYLLSEDIEPEILDYVRKFEQPNVLTEITETYLTRLKQKE